MLRYPCMFCVVDACADLLGLVLCAYTPLSLSLAISVKLSYSACGTGFAAVELSKYLLIF